MSYRDYLNDLNTAYAYQTCKIKKPKGAVYDNFLGAWVDATERSKSIQIQKLQHKVKELQDKLDKAQNQIELCDLERSAWELIIDRLNEKVKTTQEEAYKSGVKDGREAQMSEIIKCKELPNKIRKYT